MNHDLDGYIDSYYGRTRTQSPPRPSLSGFEEAEVCVIGGGMAGLATALGLAERGKSVILLEGKRIGWGASGRNGGFVSPGYSLGARAMIAKLGTAKAKALYGLTQKSLALIKQRIADFAIACDPVEGYISCAWFDQPDDLARDADFMRETFGTRHEAWSKDKVRELYSTKRYFGGVFNPDAMHLHSLNLALGYAKAAEAKGVRIFENSPVDGHDLSKPEKRIATAKGSMKAKEVVFCCSGYIDGLYGPVARATLPVRTFVILTEPLGNRLGEVIRAPYAVSDSRFASDYYRPLKDSRILWGGRIHALSTPSDLAGEMKRDLTRVFPQLDDVKVEVAWDGFMGYARHKMPMIGKSRDGVWHCTGFGGHGMCSTTAGGESIAKAIAEGDREYKLFAPFGLTWAGGPLGPLAAQTTYWYYQMRDALRA